MINFTRWVHSPAPQGYQQQRSSIVGDTIVTVALSSIALLTAQALERTAPDGALLLRCVAGGLALVWLLKRCLPNGNGYVQQQHGHASSSPVTHHRSWYNWFIPRPLYVAPVNRYQAPPPYVPTNMPIVQPMSMPPPQGNYFPKVQPYAPPHTKLGSIPSVPPLSPPKVHPTTLYPQLQPTLYPQLQPLQNPPPFNGTSFPKVQTFSAPPANPFPPVNPPYVASNPFPQVQRTGTASGPVMYQAPTFRPGQSLQQAPTTRPFGANGSQMNEAPKYRPWQ